MAGFGVSYGGIPLGVDTPEALAFIDSAVSLEYVRETCPVPHYPGLNLQQLAWPQWPARPPLRIGDWFYPTGMSRWSEAHFLADRPTVDRLRQIAWNHSTGSVPNTLAIRADPDGYEKPLFQPSAPGIQTPMYLLPPRPLGEVAGQLTGLYLVTFVDERYHLLAGASSLLGDPANGTTWDGLIKQLATDLGITLDYQPPWGNGGLGPGASYLIPAAYGQPEMSDSSLWANRESSSMLMDAVAWNVGKVVVRNINLAPFGQYRLANVGSQYQGGLDYLDYFKDRTGGGDVGGGLDAAGLVRNAEAVLPRTVAVSFPVFLDSHSFVDARRSVPQYSPPYGDVYTVAVNLADLGAPYGQYAGMPFTHFFHDTAKAFAANSGDTTPANASTLQTLAKQIAQDYWSGLLAGLDEVYGGVLQVEPESVHDFLWSVRGTPRAASTRISRKPWNYGVLEFQHYLPPPGSESVGPNASPAIEIVRNTGTAFGNLCFDAWTQRWNANLPNAVPRDAENVFVRAMPPGTPVTPNTYYECRWADFEQGRKVYHVTSPLTAANNVVTVPNVMYIHFNDRDFVLAPGVGQVTVGTLGNTARVPRLTGVQCNSDGTLTETFLTDVFEDGLYKGSV